jgi:hypothetical protein
MVYRVGMVPCWPALLSAACYGCMQLTRPSFELGHTLVQFVPRQKDWRSAAGGSYGLWLVVCALCME